MRIYMLISVLVIAHIVFVYSMDPPASHEADMAGRALLSRMIQSQDAALSYLASKEESPININYQNDQGYTPLLEAISLQQLSVIRTLCERGADPYLTNTYGFNAFHEALLLGNRNILEMLYIFFPQFIAEASYKGENIFSMFGNVIFMCREASFVFLIDHRIDIEQACYGTYSALKFLKIWCEYTEQKKLSAATPQEREECARTITSYRAMRERIWRAYPDVSEREDRGDMIIAAMMESNNSRVDELLRRATASDMNMLNDQRINALVCAAQMNRSDWVEQICRIEGLDPFIVARGNIHVFRDAIVMGRCEILHVLYRFFPHAWTDARYSSWTTPINDAIFFFKADSFAFLISHGADLHEICDLGQNGVQLFYNRRAQLISQIEQEAESVSETLLNRLAECNRIEDEIFRYVRDPNHGDLIQHIPLDRQARFEGMVDGRSYVAVAADYEEQSDEGEAYVLAVEMASRPDMQEGYGEHIFQRFPHGSERHSATVFNSALEILLHQSPDWAPRFFYGQPCPVPQEMRQEAGYGNWINTGLPFFCMGPTISSAPTLIELLVIAITAGNVDAVRLILSRGVHEQTSIARQQGTLFDLALTHENDSDMHREVAKIFRECQTRRGIGSGNPSWCDNPYTKW